MLLPDVTSMCDDPSVGGGQRFTVLRTTRKHSLVSDDTEVTE